MDNGMDHLGGGPYSFFPLSARESRCPLFMKAVGYSGPTCSQQLTEDLHQFEKHLKLGRLLKSNNLFGPKVSSWLKP